MLCEAGTATEHVLENTSLKPKLHRVPHLQQILVGDGGGPPHNVHSWGVATGAGIPQHLQLATHGPVESQRIVPLAQGNPGQDNWVPHREGFLAGLTEGWDKPDIASKYTLPQLIGSPVPHPFDRLLLFHLKTEIIIPVLQDKVSNKSLAAAIPTAVTGRPARTISSASGLSLLS